MFIFKRVVHVQDWINTQRMNGNSIGFVPTMGALHSGHLSLVERCKVEAGITIVSIFVNPRQFNDPEDLKKYPRPIARDLEMLYKCGVDMVFLPEVEDIYPPGDVKSIDFDPGPAAEIMEGKFRPGHFKGMAEVVHRLLKIVTPDNLFMGQKDFQQFAIIRKMISDFGMPIHLVMCPTMRESNGLAMSSRNTRLSPQARDKAGLIYACLLKGKSSFENGASVEEIRNEFITTLENENFEVEYFELVDGDSFRLVKTMQDAKRIVACCAVKVEGIRLIDNVIWKHLNS